MAGVAVASAGGSRRPAARHRRDSTSMRLDTPGSVCRMLAPL